MTPVSASWQAPSSFTIQLELVGEDRLAGPGRGLREHRQEVPGPVAAQQPAVLPAPGHRDPGRVRPAGDLVEEHEEAALVVRAREGEHPLLLLLEETVAQRDSVQGEGANGRRAPRAPRRPEGSVEGERRPRFALRQEPSERVPLRRQPRRLTLPRRERSRVASLVDSVSAALKHPMCTHPFETNGGLR